MHEEIESFAAGETAPRGPECRALNLGYRSDRERARALEAFERLSPGDRLEIVANQRQGQLVAELQARYGTRFYWWPLQRGPLAWRMALAKPALDAPATVAAMMGADHLRLCRLWDELERAAELRQIDRVRRRSADLSLGLRRYIDIEEAVLFPLLEAQTQMSAASATAPMPAEHAGIERILHELHKLRTATDHATILEMFDGPVEPMILFERHCRKEEATLYRLMDIVFNPAEERELLSLLQEFEV
jgi:uncharacterized protein (DUF2249 family)